MLDYQLLRRTAPMVQSARAINPDADSSNPNMPSTHAKQMDVSLEEFVRLASGLRYEDIALSIVGQDELKCETKVSVPKARSVSSKRIR